jgi:polysaccharide deacetylase family protein (PEP-CTERM system associated)
MDSEPVVALSFDVEEHHRIEAAAHLPCAPETAAAYTDRMDANTRWVLDFLGERKVLATFFVVGQIAKSHPHLIRRMIDEGHEVASHSWEHRPVWKLKHDTFRDDVRASKDALEQAGGAAVTGFRAPTFSILRVVPWAIDVLAELGFRYDSSIFPVRHDRYGVYGAPRTPFIVRGQQLEMLEMPPLTLRALGQDLPIAGGGYFRLFPLWLIRRGLRQMARMSQPAVMYFHPWEFDPDQPRLPLTGISRFRTYVGIRNNREKLGQLLSRSRCCRIVDLVGELEMKRDSLPRFDLSTA